MTEGEHSAAPGKGQFDREAAEWCVRMHGEDREQWRPQFEEWLKLGALHLAAYNRIEEVYLLGAKLRSDPPAAGEIAKPLAPRRRAGGAAAAALAASLVVIAWLALPSADRGPTAPANLADGGRAQRLRIATEEGQPREVRLRDGSMVSLAGGSSLVVDIDRNQRRLELLRGTGLFRVASMPRPFTVWAGGGSVTALGTRFEVRMDPARRVHVRLLEGRVDVRAPASEQARGSRPPTRLEAGQSQTYLAEPPAGQSGPRTVAHQPVTVGELVDLANARPDATMQIRIADPRLRATRLGGRFQVRDPAIVAEQLAIMFDLEIDRPDRATLALAPRS